MPAKILFGCVADSEKPEALEMQKKLEALGVINLNAHAEEAEGVHTIIVLGGDGFLLHAVHDFLHFGKPFYGVNYGTLGFLLNTRGEAEEILDSIKNATSTKLKLLAVEIETKHGSHKCTAMNEVTLFRESGQVAKIKIYINGVLRMAELVSDGVVLSTSAGSTAYNFSLHGPIFAPAANVLSLCPVSPFRPRYWRGALISEDEEVTFEVMEPEKRPVLATADFFHFEGALRVSIKLCKRKHVELLFKDGMPLEEKILMEQFLI